MKERNPIVTFTDEFATCWHNIYDLGRTSSFLLSFKGISKTIIQLEEKVADIKNAVKNEPLLSCCEEEILKDIDHMQTLFSKFKNLTLEPNFIERLELVKKDFQDFNFLKFRSIIYTSLFD